MQMRMTPVAAAMQLTDPASQIGTQAAGCYRAAPTQRLRYQPEPHLPSRRHRPLPW